MINDNADPKNIGLINGAAGAMTSIVRAVGPLVAGPLFAKTAHKTVSNQSFPINTSLIFNLCALMLAIQLALTYKLKIK